MTLSLHHVQRFLCHKSPSKITPSPQVKSWTPAELPLNLYSVATGNTVTIFFDPWCSLFTNEALVSESWQHTYYTWHEVTVSIQVEIRRLTALCSLHPMWKTNHYISEKCSFKFPYSFTTEIQQENTQNDQVLYEVAFHLSLERESLWSTEVSSMT